MRPARWDRRHRGRVYHHNKMRKSRFTVARQIETLLAAAVLSVAVVPHAALAGELRQSTALPAPSPVRSSGSVDTALPPSPSGRATVIGGLVSDIDPVEDRITLQVFGGHSMKILFDARTHFYRDGARTPINSLRVGDRASIETVLDGTHIFAKSIHVLSQAAPGEFQGQVVAFDAASGQLTIRPASSSGPIVLQVPPGTPIVHVGQHAAGTSASRDLMRDALVSVVFQSANNGRGIAKKIDILATPGSSFVFSGNITFLDLHAHRLALVNQRDGKSYTISFDPALFPGSIHLHAGQNVKIAATFNGSGYVANTISPI